MTTTTPATDLAPRNRADRLAARPAKAARGWWARHRFLILRRLSQLAVLALFLAGPLAGIWIAKGTIAASMTFGVLPLTDPFVLLQGLVARHIPETTAVIGAVLVIAAYALVSGRAYCAWVCPINPVTDLAHWTREKLGLTNKGWQPKPETRLYVLAMVLAVSAATGTVAWELVNPISFAFRAVVFGAVGGLTLVAAVFLFDVFVARRGWCSHLCPVGAFYGLIGAKGLVRVAASNRAACDHCMDCYAVCPEPHVIVPALEGKKQGHSPVVLSRDCTTCGRCIDVCSTSVFRFTHRFDVTEPAGQDAARSHLPGETA
jgi:ferredoxin-type protein NapH